MRFLIFLGAIFLLTTSAEKCTGKKDDVYKGKLTIKGLCMNYTVSLVEGDLDTSRMVANWTDDHSGKNHKNVFALENRCSFPSTIKEGDEFYFKIDSSANEDCIVCMAYYPVPPKKLSIRVVDK